MKKSQRKTIVTLAALLLALICVFVLFKTSTGGDYTANYQLYKDVKAFSTTSELKNYFRFNGLEYTIKDNTFSANDHDISFSITKDGTCTILNSDIMAGLEILDACDYDVVTVKGLLNSDGYIYEVISVNISQYRFTKVGDTYLVKNRVAEIICFALMLLVAIQLIVVLIKFIAVKTKRSHRTSQLEKHETN